MKKNKRILLAIITILVSTMLFTNKAKAEQAMGLKCNITKSIYSEDPTYWWITSNDTGEQIFVVFTDNKGTHFWNYLDNVRTFSTIPQMIWINGVSISDYTDLEDSMKAGYSFNLNNTFSEGYCPKHIRKASSSNAAFLMDKTTPIEEASYLENPRYIIYSYKDKDGNTKKIAEGYTEKGAYAFVGPDIKLTIKDEIMGHQEKLIKNENVGYKSYFKVDENYNSLLIAGNGVTGDYSVCEGESEEWCEQNKNFKILASNSSKGKQNLEKLIAEWLNTENNQSQFDVYNDIIALTKDTEFMSILNGLKKSLSEGKEYDFSNINMDDFIIKLNNGVNALDKAFSAEFSDCGYEGSKTDITSSITSCLVYSDMLGIRNLVEIAEKQSGQNMLNQGHIISEIYKDVHDTAESELIKKNYSIDILDSSDSLSEYTELMYTAIAYLKSRANRLNLNEKQLVEIYDKYVDLVDRENLDIYPVVDCETLLGEDLIKKINSYLNIIKIAVPIIVIGLGIADFTKAIFAGEEDMKKAQKQFIKRLIIAILIFLTPTLVNLLLSLANKVWTIISPNSCGIFE